MSCYVSPVPAKILPNYRRRIEGQPALERLHMFPKPEGGWTACDPVCCRECERERSWHDHGERGQ